MGAEPVRKTREGSEFGMFYRACGAAEREELPKGISNFDASLPNQGEFGIDYLQPQEGLGDILVNEG